MNEKIEKQVDNAFNKIINELDLEFGYEGLKEDVSNILEPLKKDIAVLLNENSKLNELKEFTQIVFNKNVFIWGMAYRKKELKDYKPTYEYYKNNCGYFHSGYKFELMTEKEFDLVIKVVSMYGKKD